MMSTAVIKSKKTFKWDPLYEKELEEYHKKMKEAWKKCYNEYWDFVTKIENNWIRKREKELAEKKVWDENK